MSGVSVEIVGAVGYLTLTRTATLNAITQDMVDELHNGLREHVDNAAVKVVVLRSASEKAFCAGGDMKRIRQLVLDNDKAAIKNFFTREYALNLAIAECPKPYISLIDGVAMGGGLGLSVHGRYVVATEKALMAMPEARIGFFPDVGASHFLQQLPYSCGIWLALTAAPVRAKQTVQVGLATHYIKHDQLPLLLTQLENLNKEHAGSEGVKETDNASGIVQSCLDGLSESALDDEFNEVLRQRKEWFSGGDVESIKAQLTDASSQSDDAKKLLSLMDKGSPYSFTTTLSLFEKTKGMTLENCLAIELELSMEAAFHPDLVEGVRAVLVDKDHKANWA
ncbi:enoyl-CoA hydratase/isomerase family protein [Granulosicoccus sp.]|nr:enoyl-CoA hydratase/isomerase family protein [Granulosicoccus sp.]MDB4222694.1 enoyl-CoA hydratase/isomerase family protein [Granulosicoccus sp.]